MSIYECTFPGCGRRFKDESVLAGHIKRRHREEAENLRNINNVPNETEDYHPPEATETIEPAKATKEVAEEDDDKFLAHLKKEMKKLERPEDVNISMNDIIESRKRLTPKFLFEKSGCSELEEITQLILREENLYHFDDTDELSMDQLSSLEYLALSHNKLTLVNGISKLVNLVELNINFNLVEDITPLNECLNLEKLYASNNKIRHISGIKDLTRLKCIGLYRNRIADFDETVKVLSTFTQLQELDLDGNECTRRFTYKYDLLYHVKVEKLDGERVNPIDYELAKSFKKEKPSGQEQQEETDNAPAGLQRPSTAPGRVRPGTFVNKLKKGIQFGADNLMNIPENVNSERVAELEQELDALKERVNELEVALEEANGRETVLKLENEKLNNQLMISKVMASNADILLDNNQQLSRELQSLKALDSREGDNKDLKQENFLLHEQIMELVKEKNELKAQLDKRMMNEEHPIDRINRKNEALRITTRQSSTSQEAKDFPSQKPKTINVKSGQMSPSFRISAGTSPRVLVRGTSSEAKRSDMKVAAPPSKGSARKIVKVLPPRQGSFSKDLERSQDQDQELSDTEIEDLLIRSSLQISALRSELRNFDFTTLEQESRKGTQAFDEAEDIPDDDYDETETRDTSMQQGRLTSYKRLF